MIPATFRPLPVWPHPPTSDRRSRLTFKASWMRTLELLEREITQLGGDAVIIAANFRERDLRIDGWPRSDARVPDHPGVEISFDSVHGRLAYATDVCMWWEHNVRSIALGLEALRAVDRYGVSSRGQQYAGWKELPGAIAVAPKLSPDEAWLLLIRAVDGDPDDRGWTLDELYHRAAKANHPDTGGDTEAFQRVQHAYEVCKASGRWA